MCAPLGVQFLSFSRSVCSKNLKKNSNFVSWCTPLGKILDLPLQVVHEQKFKDVLNSTCQISPKKIVLDLESEVMRGLGSIPTGGYIFSKFNNPNLYNIARSDSLGFKTKNPNNTRMPTAHLLTLQDT